MGWGHWSYNLISKLRLLLAIYQGPIFKTLIYKKDAYGKYLPFLGTEVFKFPWMLNFGGFSAEDEQKPKLVSAHPQIPLWLQKSVMMWKSTFCTIICHFVIVIFQTVSRGQFIISLKRRKKLFYKKCYSTSSRGPFVHKSRSSTLFIADALTCFFTPPFSYTKISVRISPVCGCNSNWNILSYIIRKMYGGEETPFGIFGLEWNFNLLVQI